MKSTNNTNKRENKRDDNVETNNLKTGASCVVPFYGFMSWMMVHPKKQQDAKSDDPKIANQTSNKKYDVYMSKMKSYIADHRSVTTLDPEIYEGRYLEWLPVIQKDDEYRASKLAILKQMKPLEVQTVNNANNNNSVRFGTNTEKKSILKETDVRDAMAQLTVAQPTQKKPIINHLSIYHHECSTLETNILDLKRKMANKESRKKIVENMFLTYINIIEKTPLWEIQSLKSYLESMDAGISFRQKLALYMARDKMSKKTNTLLLPVMLDEIYKKNETMKKETVRKTIYDKERFLAVYVDIMHAIMDAFLTSFATAAIGTKSHNAAVSAIQTEEHHMYINYAELPIIMHCITTDSGSDLMDMFDHLIKNDHFADIKGFNPDDTVTRSSTIYKKVKIHMNFSYNSNCSIFRLYANKLKTAVASDKSKSEQYKKNFVIAMQNNWHAPTDEILYSHVKDTNFGSLSWIIGYKSSFYFDKKKPYRPPYCNSFSEHNFCVSIKNVLTEYKDDMDNNTTYFSVPVECSEYLSEGHIGHSSLRVSPKADLTTISNALKIAL